MDSSGKKSTIKDRHYYFYQRFSLEVKVEAFNQDGKKLCAYVLMSKGEKNE